MAGGSPKGLVPDYVFKVLKKKFPAIEDGESELNPDLGSKDEDDSV